MFKKLSIKQKGLLLAFTGVMIITPDTLVIRMVTIDTWNLLFYRSLFPGAALLIGYLVIFGNQTINHFLAIGRPGLLNALLIMCSNVAFILALANTNVANALIMISLVPLIASIFSFIFLNERPELITWICSFLCLMAVILIFYESYSLNTYLGDFYGIICASFVAGSLTIMRRHTHINFVPSYILGKLITAFLCIFLVSTFVVGAYDLLFFCIMIVTIGISFVFISLAPQYISSPEIGIFFLLETALGPLWVWYFIGENPTLNTLIGGIFIVMIIFTHSYYMIKKEQKLM